MKIAIVGYGAMGKEAEAQARQKNIEISEIFDIDRKLDANKKYDFDVAIEFSRPDAVMGNIETLCAMGKNAVVGTTGWTGEIDKVKAMVADAGTGFVWGSNFSIGMRMFFKIVDLASKLANDFEQYDVFLHEIHHKRKKDSPSGSAKSIAEILLANLDRKTRAQYETAHEAIDAEALHVSSTRGGEVTGTHTLYLDSAADVLQLEHRAKNRSGFAGGAIVAAEFICGKTGFYEFGEVLG